MAKKVKVKKIKNKTHKGTKKVLNIRQSGSISIKSQGTDIILVKTVLREVDKKEKVMNYIIQI